MARSKVHIVFDTPQIKPWREKPLSYDLKPSVFRAVITRIQADIVTRTIKENTDMDGVPFAPYSDRYAKGAVTLVNTGWMLSHWRKRISINSNQLAGKITPQTRDNPALNGSRRDYAWYVDMGSEHQAQRHFIGLTPKQEDMLKAESLDPLIADLITKWLGEQWEDSDLGVFEQQCKRLVRDSNKAWRTAQLLIRAARAQKQRLKPVYWGRIRGDSIEAIRARQTWANETRLKD